MIKILAGTVALSILAAAAHVNIEHAGGYEVAQAKLIIAVTAGIAIGAVAIGVALGEGRRFLAALIALALLCGEAYQLIGTAERLVDSREAAQVPLREAKDVHKAAQGRVAVAESALAAAPTSSARLDAALAASAAADAAVLARAGEKGCATHCRALLEKQVDAAAREVTEARAELLVERQAAEASLQAARAVLAGIPAPKSGTALADRLGVPGWSFDLVYAGLGSLAANGLAAVLLAFASHRQRETIAPIRDAVGAELAPAVAVTVDPPVTQAQPPALLSRVEDPLGHVARFACEVFEPGGSAELLDIHKTYRRWCIVGGIEPLPATEVGSRLREVFWTANLHIEGGRVRDIKLRSAALQIGGEQ